MKNLKTIDPKATQFVLIRLFVTNRNHVPKDAVWVEPDAYPTDGKVWQLAEPLRGERFEALAAKNAGLKELAACGRIRKGHTDTGEYVFPEYNTSDPRTSGAQGVSFNRFRCGLVNQGFFLAALYVQPRYDDVKRSWKYAVSAVFVPKIATPEQIQVALWECGFTADTSEAWDQTLRARSERGFSEVMNDSLYVVHVYNNPVFRRASETDQFEIDPNKVKFTVNAVMRQPLRDEQGQPAVRWVTDPGTGHRAQQVKMTPELFLVVQDHQMQFVKE